MMNKMQDALDALLDAEESAFYAFTRATDAAEKAMYKAQDTKLREMIAELSHMVN